MNVVLFCHSLLSDWNHGNAHFLRGVVTELIERGARVDVYEPRDAWSVQNLVAERGPTALEAAPRAYPLIAPIRYDDRLDLQQATAAADLVIVHEWNDPRVVRDLGALRKRAAPFRLLFHDTHHRSATSPHEIARYDLSGYDGVLAFGRVVRDLYLRNGWAGRAWTWHEAADIRVFHPLPSQKEYDLVWVGNWGDEERTGELEEFLIMPTGRLRDRKIAVHGVRYPRQALDRLAEARIEFRGYLPNLEAPHAYARSALTVHVPRRFYANGLSGVPTIRVFEALACGVPLLCSPWVDTEGLFRAGEDYICVKDGRAMEVEIRNLLADEAARQQMANNAAETIGRRHTCAHRAAQLLEICEELGK